MKNVPPRLYKSKGRSFVQDKNGNLRNSAPKRGLIPPSAGPPTVSTINYTLFKSGHPRFFLTVFLLHKRPNIFIVLHITSD